MQKKQTVISGQTAVIVESLDSTQSYLKHELNNKELKEGYIILAHEQTSGRGMGSNKWISEKKMNLTFSILLKPVFIEPYAQFILNKTISLAIADFIKTQTNDIINIKWPNDIYWENKKIAGIIIENSIKGNKIENSVIGIGININQTIFSKNIINPVSLKNITKKNYDIKEMLDTVCNNLDKRYNELKNRPSAIDKDYLKNLYRFNEWSNYIFQNTPVKAKITGISEFGKLQLITESDIQIESDMKEIIFC